MAEQNNGSTDQNSQGNRTEQQGPKHIITTYKAGATLQEILRRRGAARSVLHIRVPPRPLDPLAVEGLAKTAEQYSVDEKALLKDIQKKGLSARIQKVAEFLSQLRDLSDMRKRILAATFAKNVKDLLKPNGPDPKDTRGFADAVLFEQEASGGPVEFFVTHVVEKVLEQNNIQLGNHEKERLISQLQWKDFPVGPGKIEKAVLDEVREILDKGLMPAYVEEFAQKGEVDEVQFTNAVKQAMVDYLLRRGINLKQEDEADFLAGKYDEYFALAYEHAIAAGGGRDGGDPLQAVRSGGPSPPWNFSVDTFEDVEEQGIVRDNILAAGAIDYICELGERMGILKLADVLILNWSSGAIDVAAGEAGDMLYAYWKNRDDRTTPEDRGMLYKRVLDKGDANILSRMVANEHFGTLWHNLMSEVAEYIRRTEKIEEGRGESSPVSRSRIYQATRELQYNLTEYCTGMAHKQAHELYSQLQDAIAVLSHEDVMTHFGGRHRKSLWTVIEQMSKAEFGASPSIGAVRSLAVDGNKVFQWIADFDKATVTNQQFDEFLEAAEAYILNMATVDEMPGFGEEEEDFEDDFEDEFENEDEDFEDF